MYENDYVWLLKTLANTSVNINQLYGLKVRIPEIILLNSGEPKLWFYQEKDQVKARSENLLKMQIVKEYFSNPQILENPQSVDNEYMIRKSKSTLNFNESNKPLFCVYIEIPSKEIKTIKKISKGVADELFSNFADNADYCKQWTKIFSYIPNKSACLYDVNLSREGKDENYKLKIVKKDYGLKDIKTEDFAPPEGMNQRKELFPRDEKTGTDKFSSIASTINAVLDKTVKGVARFLESKTKLTIGELKLEVIVDANYNTWIIGSKGINFYNKKGELEKDSEKESLVFPKTVLKHYFQCPGTYCNFVGETNFHQEGDEAINLYKKNNHKHETFEIPFKTVILDIIEKCKQIERFQKNLPEYSTKHILQYIETHPFEFRKYYSIGELLQSYLFKGYKVSNLYSNMRVCQNCHFIYEKIDGYRIQKVLKPENTQFNTEHIKSVMEKYFEDHTLVSNRNERDKKEVFSRAFYEKLESFDKNILQILGLEKKVETMEYFFEMTAAQLRRLSPIPERRSEASVKSRSSIRPSVKFPTINKEIISDPRNIVTRERLRMPASRMVEVIGYKHHLGHANNLRDTGAGYALSKSSIHLNKLHDKLHQLRLNTDFSGDNVFENSSTKDGSEYGTRNFTEESRGRITLPNNEKPMLFHQRIKGLDAERSRENRDSLFNVAVDKINFFSEEEKMELFEKENKKKEKETQEKNFYEKNGLLAQSILSNPLFSKKVISTKNLLEVHSQNPEYFTK